MESLKTLNITEEDFNPTIGDADFGVKESVEKFRKSSSPMQRYSGSWT
jgi:hypothetical protein